MMAFTVWGVWAHGITWLDKRIENRKGRPWKRLLGQRIAIHAGAYVGGRKGTPGTLDALYKLEGTCLEADGLGIEWSDFGLFGQPEVRPPRGHWRPIVTSAIVCTAVLAREERNEGQDPPPWADRRSPWWWHLADVEVLATPVPCKGAQGFWPAPPIPGVTR